MGRLNDLDDLNKKLIDVLSVNFKNLGVQTESLVSELSKFNQTLNQIINLYGELVTMETVQAQDCQLIDDWMEACGDSISTFYETPVEVIRKFAELTLISHNHFNDVKSFHVKFGHLTNEVPKHLTKRKLLERIKFLQEELDEFTEACGIRRTTGEFNQDGIYVEGTFYEMIDQSSNGIQKLDHQADGLVDLVYVALGTAVMMGLPWQTLWNDVQRANMAKVRGVGHRGNLVDCIKPEGWIPPNPMQILLDAGYNPSDQLNNSSHVDDEIHIKSPSV